MNFICQQSAVLELQSLAQYNRHSILIEGSLGCGKTFLARQYAKYLNTPDFQVIVPTVQAIRDCIEQCVGLDNPLVVCIENLDSGVKGAAYTLLKFLEEPADNIYVVITCRNINNLPDTIISRSSVVTINPPVSQDIHNYAQYRDSTKFIQYSSTDLWSAVRSFQDVDIMLGLSLEQIEYIQSLYNLVLSSESASSIVWKFTHFSDNKELPVELALQYCMMSASSYKLRQLAVSCLNELSKSRIAQHVIITQFIFQFKKLSRGV